MSALVVDDGPAALINDFIIASSVHAPRQSNIGSDILVGEKIITRQGYISDCLRPGDSLCIVKEKLPLAYNIGAQMQTHMELVVDSISGFNKKPASNRQVSIGRKSQVDAYVYFKRFVVS